MINNKKHVRIETCGLKYILTVGYLPYRAPGHSYGAGTIDLEDQNSDIDLHDDEDILDRSFVIERQPGRKGDDCKKDEAAGLKPVSCKGEMAFRNLTEDD